MVGEICLVLIFGMAFGSLAIASIFQNKSSSSLDKFLTVVRELKGQTVAQSSGQPMSEVENLRNEVRELTTQVKQLRETSTQYDLSIQDTLDENQRRLARLETRVAAANAAQNSEQGQTRNLGR